jgi:hypothetical protein
VPGWMPTTVVAVSLTLAGLAPARANPQPLGCPTPGTTLTARNPQGDYKLVVLKSITPDPSVCTSITDGPGADENAGKPTRRIYGWYDVSHYIWPPEMETKARSALAAILSGEQQQSSFNLTLRRVGIVQPWSGTVTWQRTGTATIALGAAKIETILVKNTFEGGGNRKYNEVWDLWYSPLYHLWIKGEKRNTAGGVVIGGFEVTSLSPGADPAKTHGLLPPSLKRPGANRAVIPQH